MKSPNNKMIDTKKVEEKDGEDFFFPSSKLGYPVTIRAKSREDAERELESRVSKLKINKE